jgi:hypothetical protein
LIRAYIFDSYSIIPLYTLSVVYSLLPLADP